MGFKLNNKVSSKSQYLIYASIPKISTPYLLVIGDISTGGYNIIDYATEEEARKRKEQERGLARILKAFPVRKIKPRFKNIEGFAVYRRIDQQFKNTIRKCKGKEKEIYNKPKR